MPPGRSGEGRDAHRTPHTQPLKPHVRMVKTATVMARSARKKMLEPKMPRQRPKKLLQDMGLDTLIGRVCLGGVFGCGGRMSVSRCAQRPARAQQQIPVRVSCLLASKLHTPQAAMRAVSCVSFDRSKRRCRRRYGVSERFVVRRDRIIEAKSAGTSLRAPLSASDHVRMC